MEFLIYILNKLYSKILNFPLTLDQLTIYFSVVLFIICFKNYKSKIISCSFTGFHIYFFLLLIIGIINYVPSYSNDYFSNALFFNGLIKLTLIYFICRIVLFSTKNIPAQTELAISIISFVIFLSVIASIFTHFIDPDTSIISYHMERKRSPLKIFRYSGILKEPSYIACIGLSFIMILFSIKKQKIRLSPFLSLIFSSILSKSFSCFILIYNFILITLFYKSKIYIDKRISFFIISIFLCFIFITPNNALSVMGYYKRRIERVFIHKTDPSFNNRLIKPTNDLEKLPLKTFFLGSGLSQHNGFNKHYQTMTHMNSIVTSFVAIGIPFVLIIFLFFIDRKNILGFIILISFSMLTGSFPSIPISILFMLTSKQGSWHNLSAKINRKLKKVLP